MNPDRARDHVVRRKATTTQSSESWGSPTVEVRHPVVTSGGNGVGGEGAAGAGAAQKKPQREPSSASRDQRLETRQAP